MQQLSKELLGFIAGKDATNLASLHLVSRDWREVVRQTLSGKEMELTPSKLQLPLHVSFCDASE